MSQLPADFPKFIQKLASEYRLNDLEIEALLPALEGETASEIAKRLEITSFAVRKRLGSVYSKFDIEGNVLGKLEKLKAILLKQYEAAQTKTPPPKQNVDLSQLPVAKTLYGRDEDLQTLEDWIIDRKSRIVTVLGIGGIGKTSIAVKLVDRLQQKFDYVYGLTLRTAPPLKDVLSKLIKFLSDNQIQSVDLTEEKLVDELLEQFRNQRCLVVIDNVETILRKGELGYYRDECRNYSEFFKRVGEEFHESCLLLTTRERPKDIELLEASALPVQTLPLVGLKVEFAQEFFKDFLRQKSVDDQPHLQEAVKNIIETYAGNPLILQMVSGSVKSLFAGDLAAFLKEVQYSKETVTFLGDLIRVFLDQIIERLSDVEKQVMYWLAINRESISFSVLRSDFIPPISQTNLLKALDSLKKRFLIEVSEEGFMLQPVVMEYMTDRFVDDVAEELLNAIQLNIEQPQIERRDLLRSFHRHALIKAQADDYIRRAQTEFILQSIVEKLLERLQSKEVLKAHLVKEILPSLRSEFFTAGSLTTQAENQFQPSYAGGNLLNILVQLHSQPKTPLEDYDFSQLAIWQAYLQNVELHGVDFRNSDLDKSVFTRIMGSILAVKFGQDAAGNEVIITSDVDGKIRRWNVENNREFSAFSAHENWVRTIALSPDGKQLVTGGDDYQLQVWDWAEGRHLQTLGQQDGHQNWICSARFSPDGKTLASASQDGSIRLWELSSGKLLKILPLEADKKPHSQPFWSIAFSPDGQRLASGSSDNIVRIWEVNSGQCIRKIPVGKDKAKQVFSVTFSPDGQWLAAGGDDAIVRLWHTQAEECFLLKGHTAQVRSVAFSQDGTLLATAGDDYTVRLWNVETRKHLKTLEGHTERIWSVCFNSNAQLLATGSDDQTLRLWKISTGECLKTHQGYTDGIWSVAFSSDSQTLASGSDDNIVRVWNLKHRELTGILKGHKNRVWSVAFKPKDPTILASGSSDNTVRLWDVKNRKFLGNLKGITDWVWTIAFSPDGQLLASAGDDPTIKLCNTKSGECIDTLGQPRYQNGHTRRVWSVCFSPDGKRLASSSDDCTVKIWCLHSDEEPITLPRHKERVRIWSVAFSPDGQAIATGDGEGKIELWDAETGQHIRSIGEHRDRRVWSVAFHPTQPWIATGSDDGLVKVWNFKTAKPFRSLKGHRKWVCSVAFSPDGELLASGSQDGEMRLWECREFKEVASLKSPKPYDGSVITGTTGLSNAQKSDLKALGAVDYDGFS